MKRVNIQRKKEVLLEMMLYEDVLKDKKRSIYKKLKHLNNILEKIYLAENIIRQSVLGFKADGSAQLVTGPSTLSYITKLANELEPPNMEKVSIGGSSDVQIVAVTPPQETENVIPDKRESEKVIRIPNKESFTKEEVIEIISQIVQQLEKKQ